jgi:hypothetical protein
MVTDLGCMGDGPTPSSALSIASWTVRTTWGQALMQHDDIPHNHTRALSLDGGKKVLGRGQDRIFQCMPTYLPMG